MSGAGQVRVSGAGRGRARASRRNRNGPCCPFEHRSEGSAGRSDGPVDRLHSYTSHVMRGSLNHLLRPNFLSLLQSISCASPKHSSPAKHAQTPPSRLLGPSHVCTCPLDVDAPGTARHVRPRPHAHSPHRSRLIKAPDPLVPAISAKLQCKPFNAEMPNRLRRDRPWESYVLRTRRRRGARRRLALLDARCRAGRMTSELRRRRQSRLCPHKSAASRGRPRALLVSPWTSRNSSRS
jgi:hypothetical protein